VIETLDRHLATDKKDLLIEVEEVDRDLEIDMEIEILDINKMIDRLIDSNQIDTKDKRDKETDQSFNQEVIEISMAKIDKIDLTDQTDKTDQIDKIDQIEKCIVITETTSEIEVIEVIEIIIGDHKTIPIEEISTEEMKEGEENTNPDTTMKTKKEACVKDSASDAVKKVTWQEIVLQILKVELVVQDSPMKDIKTATTSTTIPDMRDRTETERKDRKDRKEIEKSIDA
jgi:hypothetical protein